MHDHLERLRNTECRGLWFFYYMHLIIMKRKQEKNAKQEIGKFTL